MATARTIGDVPGISVGHFTDARGLTGCSVVLCPDGAEAVVMPTRDGMVYTSSA